MNAWGDFKIMALVLAAGLPALRVDADDANRAGMADKKTYLADVSALLKKQWPGNRTVNIVCHGHSVPAGYFVTPKVDTMNAYPHLLHQGLKERFPSAVLNVIVTAIGGENSSSGAERFEKDVLSHNPDAVTIDYGLNDRVLGPEKARANLIVMIEKAKARNIKVLLLTPTADTGARLDDPNDALNKQAEMIRALANEQNVALVDSLAEFQDYVTTGGRVTDLMSQVNHPNRKGHDLVVKQILDWFP